MDYPVSKEKCSKCGACHMVTKNINGKILDENEKYFQCIAMMEDICAITEKMKEVEI